MAVTKNDANKTPFIVKYDSNGNVRKIRISGDRGGEIAGSIQTTNQGLSYIAAGAGLEIISASNGQILVKLSDDSIDSLAYPDINLIPSPTSMTGTIETTVGSVYIVAGSYASVIALLGSVSAADTSFLKFKKFSDGATVLTLSTAPGTVTHQASTGSVVFSSSDWYNIVLYGSSVSGSSICTGVKFIR